MSPLGALCGAVVVAGAVALLRRLGDPTPVVRAQGAIVAGTVERVVAETVRREREAERAWRAELEAHRAAVQAELAELELDRVAGRGWE